MPATSEFAAREPSPTTDLDTPKAETSSPPAAAPEPGNRLLSAVLDRQVRKTSPDPLLGAALGERIPNGAVIARLAEIADTAVVPQRLPKVSKPTDPLEREAGNVGRRIMAASRGAEPWVASGSESAKEGREAGGESSGASVAGDVLRAEGGIEADPEAAPAEIPPAAATALANPGPGKPLPEDIREQVEAFIDADLSGVRLHTDDEASAAAASLGARAFTHGSDIFLAEGESPADLELMAHESVHVVQQGAAESLQRMVAARQAGEEIQRDLLPDVPTSMADFARYIPGFDLFTVIIGVDPFTGASVPATPENLVRGLMGVAPGGAFVYAALEEVDVVQPAFAFVQGQLSEFGLTEARLEQLLDETWKEMDLTPRIGIIDENVVIVERNFGRLLNDVISFAGSLVSGILEFIKEAAVDVAEDLVAESPTWEALKEILHYDPLRGEPVDVPTVEILAHVLTVLGKETELEQMRERGTLQETADWLDTQFATFSSLLTELTQIVEATWDAIQPENLPNLMSNLESLAQRALGFFQRVIAFGVTLAAEILRLIKDALLSWLSDVAHETPGFHLITVILGKNPFTEEAVPRTAENLIKGFITLLPGGEGVYADLAETGVIGTAAGNIEAAVEELGISWELITGTFLGIWNELTLENLIEPIATFQRIVDQFGEPIERIFAFIRVVFEEVIRLIAALTGFPGGLIDSIVTNAMAAYEDIKSDPAKFFSNMIEALKTGFENFFGGFLGHLMAGLIDWLFKTIEDAGLIPPADLSLSSILDFVFEVLGISIERLWSELAERIGQERVDQMRAALDRLTGFFTFVRDVATEGPAAIWAYVEEQLSGLWDTILETATTWIMETIVERVAARLISMLDPTGIMAAVNTCIAVYDAIQSAIEYMTEILEIIDGWVATLAAVARGDIGPGAERVEGGLAASIPVAIGFLARQVGLDDLGEKIAEIVEGIRELVDRAIDWLMDQAMAAAESLIGMLGFGPESEEEGEGMGEEPASEADQTDEEGDPRFRALSAIAAESLALTDITALGADIRAVLDRYDEEGLDQLQGKVDGSLETISFSAAASPPETRSIAFSAVFPRIDAGIEQLRGLLTQEIPHPITGLRGSVAAGVSVNGSLVAQTVNVPATDPSDHTTHAEQILLGGGDLDRALSQAQGLALAGQPATFTISVSTATCRDCAGRLTEWLNSARSRLGPERELIDFQLAFARLYEPGSTTDEERWNEFLKEATRYSDLMALAQAGWDVMALEMDESWLANPRAQGRRVLAEACAKVATTIASRNQDVA